MDSNPIYSEVTLSKSPKRHEVRLLTLERGRFDDDLVVHIRRETLKQKRPPKYEALSYVWGSPENPLHILAIAGKVVAPLSVTRNLDSALRHLRHMDGPRTLWIDAICINQADLRERGRQVAKMTRVYELADKVVIWLGPEADGSSLAMATLQTIGSKVVTNWAAHTIMPAKGLEAGDMHFGSTEYGLPCHGEEIAAIERLVQRPWFERLWVIQEARRANAHAIVVCGYSTILWMTFLDSMLCFLLKGSPESFMLDDSGRYSFIISFTAIHRPSTIPDMPYILQKTSSWKCTDDRDRIYAVVPLTGISLAQLGIIPDYDKQVWEVYTDFVLKYLRLTADLNIITILSGRSTASPSSPKPSWVPSFASQAETNAMKTSNPAGYIPPDWTYLGNGVLSVAGISCVTIDQVTPLSIPWNNWEFARERILEIMPHDLRQGRYVTGCSLMEALAATLVCCDGLDYERPQRNDWSARQLYDIMADILAPGTCRSEVLYYLHGVYEHSVGRALIRSPEGYMALASEHAQPGDIICVLFGVNNCVVLRQTGDGRYRIVSDCFVYGLHRGEAVHGPIPDGYSMVVQNDAELHLNAQTFRDDRTGRLTEYDPRLRHVACPRSTLEVFQRLLRLALRKPVVKREQLLLPGVAVKHFELV